MLNRKAYKWIRKWIVLSLCIGFSLSGCGKQAEAVTDYGKSTTTDQSITECNNTSDSSEGSSTSETGEWMSEQGISDAINGHKLSDWLGGKSLTWNNSFSAGSVPVDVNFTL